MGYESHNTVRFANTTQVAILESYLGHLFGEVARKGTLQTWINPDCNEIIFRNSIPADKIFESVYRATEFYADNAVGPDAEIVGTFARTQRQNSLSLAAATQMFLWGHRIVCFLQSCHLLMYL